MRNGFLLTGITFTLMVIVIISANYFLLSNQVKEKMINQNMKIDKVYNRYIDTVRIVKAAFNDVTSCGDKKARIEAALSKPLINSTGANVTAKAGILTSSPCVISVNFTVDSFDGAVHKEANITVS